MLIYGWFIKADSHTLYFNSGMKYRNIQVYKTLPVINIQDMEIGKLYDSGHFTTFMIIGRINWLIFKP